MRKIALWLIEAGIPTPKTSRYWSTSSVSNILRQPAYAGTFYYNRRSYMSREAQASKQTPGYRPLVQLRPQSEWIAVAVPAIVEPEIWTRSQTLHEVNTRFSPRHVGAQRYLLRYLVRFGECGQVRAATATGSRKNGVHHYYACRYPLPMHLRPETSAVGSLQADSFASTHRVSLFRCAIAMPAPQPPPPPSSAAQTTEESEQRQKRGRSRHQR